MSWQLVYATTQERFPKTQDLPEGDGNPQVSCDGLVTNVVVYRTIDDVLVRVFDARFSIQNLYYLYVERLEEDDA